MSAAERAVDKHEFFPGLEGLRGYCILIVFIAHYLGPAVLPTDGSPVLAFLEKCLTGFQFVVPVFFVISGFMISDILLETHERQGYFAAFYSRRLLRICPAYFLTLCVLAALHAFKNTPIDPRFWTNFLFVQNLLPGYLFSHTVPSINEIGHLWFIAVIFQFYLLWPVVVWLFPHRGQLLRITWTLIALICAIRVAAPFLHLSVNDSYVSTATRADAILLGVALSLYRRNVVYKRLEAWAGGAAVLAMAALIFIALWTGTGWPKSYRRVAVIHPLANIAAALLVIAVMKPNSYFCRICSLGWARWLGNLSFAIYVFHFAYSKWFLGSLTPRLAALMPLSQALTISALAAFALTIALAVFNRRFVEQPIRSLTSRIKYGQQRTLPTVST